MLTHTEAVNRTAAVAGGLAEYPQQAIGFQAGACTEAAGRLPVHLPTDVFADDVRRIGNTDHDTAKIDLF